MAFNISYVYHAVDKFTPTANKVKRSVDRLAEKVGRASASFQSLGRKMRGVGDSMLTRVTLPLAAMGAGMLYASGTMEQMQISFESMLGSGNKAKAMMKDLVTFAAKTPFELTGIGGATKQLLAFGVEQKDIISNLQVLGDISAGASVPLQDMAAIFGKVKAKGKAMTEEILQLSDRGIPIIDVLSKKYKITGNDVLELASKSKLSFAVIEDALKSMTNKGGIFHQQMIKQSRTLFGLFSTLKDVIFDASSKMGDALIGTTRLKDKMLDLSVWIEKATAKFMALKPETKNLIINIGLATAVIAPLLLVLGALSIALGLAVKGFVLLAAPIVFLASPIGLIAAAFATAGVALYNFSDGFKSLVRSIVGFVLPDWFQSLIDFKVNPEFNKISDSTKERLRGKSFGDFDTSGTGLIGGATPVSNKVQSNILTGEIAVRALQGTAVDSASVSTKGASNVNLGLSMAGGY